MAFEVCEQASHDSVGGAENGDSSSGAVGGTEGCYGSADDDLSHSGDVDDVVADVVLPAHPGFFVDGALVDAFVRCWACQGWMRS